MRCLTNGKAPPFEGGDRGSIPRTAANVTIDWLTRVSYRPPDFYKNAIRNDPCVYCGERSSGRDHIVPRVFGGANGWENRAPACRKCDETKSDTSLLLFLFDCHDARSEQWRADVKRRGRERRKLAFKNYVETVRQVEDAAR